MLLVMVAPAFAWYATLLGSNCPLLVNRLPLFSVQVAPVPSDQVEPLFKVMLPLMTIASRTLAEVRHDRGQKAAKSFRISLGSREVCTTFAIEFEPFGEADAELLQ